MKELFLIIAIPAVLFVLWSIFVGSVPKYSGITLKQLARYSQYLSNALEHNGFIELEGVNSVGPIKIRKKEYKTKPKELQLELSSGFHSRQHLQATSELLSSKGIEHKLTVTKEKGLPKRITIPVTADNSMVSLAISNVIGIIYNSVSNQNNESFTLTCWGPFKPGFVPEDGEVLEKTSSYNAGYLIGRMAGNIARIFKN